MIRDYNIADDAAIAMHKIAAGGTIFGERFFVDYRNGSDNFDGKTKDRAFKTLSKALANANTNHNDAIFIDGDSTVVETSMIDWSKNRIHVFGDNGPAPGLGYGCGAKVSLTATSGATNIATLRCTGVRNTFNAIKFLNASTVAQGIYCVAEAGEYNRYNFCEIYKSTDLTEDLAAEILMNGDSSQFYNCTIGDLVNEKGGASKSRPGVILTRETVTGKVCRDGAFVGCRFLTKANTSATSCIHSTTATDVERSLMIHDCIFINAHLATADPAVAISIDEAQTQGKILISGNSAILDISAWATSSKGVYLVGGSTPADTTTGIAVAVDGS